MTSKRLLLRSQNYALILIYKQEIPKRIATMWLVSKLVYSFGECSMPRVYYGTNQEPSFELEESPDLIAVRTQSRDSVNLRGPVPLPRLLNW